MSTPIRNKGKYPPGSYYRTLILHNALLEKLIDISLTMVTHSVSLLRNITLLKGISRNRTSHSEAPFHRHHHTPHPRKLNNVIN
jgi:hypothetical protein